MKNISEKEYLKALDLVRDYQVQISEEIASYNSNKKQIYSFSVDEFFSLCDDYGIIYSGRIKNILSNDEFYRDYDLKLDENGHYMRDENGEYVWENKSYPLDRIEKITYRLLYKQRNSGKKTIEEFKFVFQELESKLN